MRIGNLDALKKEFAEFGEKAKFTQGAIQQTIDNTPTLTIKEWIEGMPEYIQRAMLESLNINLRLNMNKTFYGFLDLDIGDFFFNTRTKFYGIKVSRYMFFDVSNRYLSKLDPDYINNEKIYIKCLYEVW